MSGGYVPPPQPRSDDLLGGNSNFLDMSTPPNAIDPFGGILDSVTTSNRATASSGSMYGEELGSLTTNMGHSTVNSGLDDFFSQTSAAPGPSPSAAAISNPFGSQGGSSTATTSATTGLSQSVSPSGQMTGFGSGNHASGGGSSSGTSGLPQSLQNQIPEFLQNAKHPTVCLFHLLFKFLTLFVYFFGGYLWSNSVLTYIFCILFLAFDFWTVKNVTGRLLVGLRWWNIIRDDDYLQDGSPSSGPLPEGGYASEWVFESMQDESQLDAIDKNVFWLGTYCWALVWTALLFINVISFNLSWIVFLTIAQVFAWTNLVAFWKCSRDQKSKLKEWATGSMLNSALGVLQAGGGGGGIFERLGKMV